ncbi:MAG: addiction module antidote protein, HigA family [Betaproteobacteria bacterium]|jgi:addiction module HigA family antidote|nr:addiction module antidote protein, HigA family [Betaproteobacteria bacterium]
MSMHNPPHPGEFIMATYMDPFGLSCRSLAEHLGVSASTLNRVLKGQSGVSPEMALRLSKALGRSPESWLAMQDTYNLAVAKRSIVLKTVKKIDLQVA